MPAIEIRRGVCRLLVDMGYAPMAEVSLRTGRRVDVMGIGPHGELIVVEIKSSLVDFRTDKKWTDYLDFTDHFYFAVDPSFPQEVLPAEQGLIVADAFGGAIIREAPKRAVAGSRRKSIMQRFARSAAMRLHAIDDAALDQPPLSQLSIK